MTTDSFHTKFLADFDAYGDAIFRFCLVKTGNKELSEDITQDTFMRYWRKLSLGEEMTNTRSFLYTIANHLVIDWYRKKKSDSLDAHIDNGFEPSDSTSTNAEIDTEYKMVLDTINKLEESDREVLLLRYVDGLGPAEIADILEEEANTISVRLNRATKRLQKHLHI